MSGGRITFHGVGATPTAALEACAHCLVDLGLRGELLSFEATQEWSYHDDTWGGVATYLVSGRRDEVVR